MMGVPSPLNGSSASPLLQAKLKQLSPELPLLQSIEEQAIELLPPASMDLISSDGQLRKVRKWQDAESADEQDDDSKDSTDLPHDSICSFECQSSQELELLTKECQSRSISEEDLQTKGVIQMDASALVELTGLHECVLIQVLCQVWRDGYSGMTILPCHGDDVTADCQNDVFWCYASLNQDGSVLITPCSDADVCGIVVDASGRPLEKDAGLENEGGPTRPSPDAYAPTWVYGQQWPFCAAPTTLVLSNLPSDLLQEDLIEILDKENFNGFYDFVHLPMDDEGNLNSGYAIVNLTRHEYGLSLSALMHGRTSWCGTSSSPCQATWSIPLQGRKQLIEHYRDHPSNRDSVPCDMRPQFFSGGWPSPFPSPDVTESWA